ncbi:predicted protein [Uncinocarpus reesii 1704]|uniref:HhH-GPD domain-containing protein n=1 Tax=Uncinocarpus reesii (strain UAMH 1704) TaxID=336963 RepID=C4JKP7_UNCRE|nr:uncharacterized protein UREG_00645 [Uncinocarpus reesii 1704]EEP75798.1 predicted protein [Uncinocarpus reesii 1704]
MVTTRAQERAEATSGQKPTKAEQPIPAKKHTAEKKNIQKAAGKVEKRKLPKRGEEEHKKGAEKPVSNAVRNDIDKLIAKRGSLPLDDLNLRSRPKPGTEMILALLMEAMLKAAPISHQKAEATLGLLLEHGFQDVNNLKNSSWDERAKVLIQGGYRHYYKRAASNLAELADWVIDKYEGDLENFHAETGGSNSRIRSTLKEIKGFGDVAVDIFLASVQSAWPETAPFIAERSLQTAEHIGIGTDVEAIFKTLHSDSKDMCKLARALTEIRLEKEEQEFQVHEE